MISSFQGSIVFPLGSICIVQCILSFSESNHLRKRKQLQSKSDVFVFGCPFFCFFTSVRFLVSVVWDYEEKKKEKAKEKKTKEKQKNPCFLSCLFSFCINNNDFDKLH